jgi:hypothetical protein
MALVSQSRQGSYFASYSYGYATRPAGRRHATRLSSSM